MSRTGPPRTRTSPQDVRRKNFTYGSAASTQTKSARLANDLEGILAQVATLTQENETLTEENQLLHSGLSEARARPMEQATDQAVSMLNQAQQLTDSLIDEAMQAARDLLLTARSQLRDIMEQAKMAAGGAVCRDDCDRRAGWQPGPFASGRRVPPDVRQGGAGAVPASRQQPPA
jgi:regulator of replication initiation timing